MTNLPKASQPQKRLLGIGGAHIDRRGMMREPFIAGASIPGAMMEEPGGGVFNALRVAVQLGVSASLLSVRGGDAAGDSVAAAAKRSGLEDLSSTFLDRTTASYTALLTKDGDVVAALADMDIYETALPRQISRRATRNAIAACDAILTDANMPEMAIQKLLALTGANPVFALAISPAKAVRLRPVLSQLAGLFLNRREALAILERESADLSALSELASGLVALGLPRAILSDGGGPVCVIDHGVVQSLTPPTPSRIVDVTGAGDAMAGATLAAFMKGEVWSVAASKGLLAAKLTVESSLAVVVFEMFYS
jgi:pseudouridine kinase